RSDSVFAYAARGLMPLPVAAGTWLSSQFFCRFSQNSGLAPRARDSFTAISALMPRFCRQISLMVLARLPMCAARASEEIYREVRRIRDEKKKRIVADIAVVGASGGYYVASGTNKIFANDASVVGSIGAIMDWYNYGDLMRWAKLKEEVIKSGEFKDTGDPGRELTPAERAYLQGMVNNMKEQFVAAIANGRGLKAEDVNALADGRVWTGQQALTLKLVDQIGDFEAAVKDTAKAVGIKGEPSLVRPAKERHSLLELIFGDASEWLPDRGKLMQRNPGFYFLWK
ncbi:MAG: signal peptide peptidase SppA, partial [Acidobacteriia bacterium]|nr:signal peptide peptidase SppA [Terriglobia bacterium]